MARLALGWMLWLAVALTVAVTVAPPTAGAQGAPAEVRKLGVMHPNDATKGHHLEALLRGLGERGWVEGHNLQIVYSREHAAYTRVPDVVATFVRDPVDVIYVPGIVGARLARQATTTIPIVFRMGPDPVAAGLAQSLARPGGNLTGIAGFVGEVNAKKLELLRELLPAAQRVALLVNPANPNAPQIVQASRQAARDDGFELLVLEARDGAELTAAFARIERTAIDALVIGSDGVLRSQEEAIARFARARRLPVLADPWFLECFSLLNYGVSARADMQRVAYYIDRILRGAKPAELPIERPSRFELRIDLGVARALGIKVPDSLLRIADEVVE